MVKPPTVLVAWRCPRPLLEAIDARAKRDGTDRSGALRSLVAAALAPAGSVEGQLRALRREIAALRQTLERRSP